MPRTVMSNELSCKFFHKTEGLFSKGELHREIADLGFDFHDKTVLDLAAGTGHWEEVFLSLGAKKAIWQDLSNHFYDTAKRRLQCHENVEFILADMTAIPLPEESVDFAMCRDSLYHSPDEQKTLAEVCRVLKPGGYFYLTSRNWKRIFRERLTFWSPIKLMSPHICRFVGKKVIPTVYLLEGITVVCLQKLGYAVEKIVREDSTFSILARKQGQPSSTER